MHRDIKNWRDLTDQELKELFYNFMAINSVEGHIPEDAAIDAITAVELFIEKLQSVEFINSALSVIDKHKLHEKDFEN